MARATLDQASFTLIQEFPSKTRNGESRAEARKLLYVSKIQYRHCHEAPIIIIGASEMQSRTGSSRTSEGNVGHLIRQPAYA